MTKTVDLIKKAIGRRAKLIGQLQAEDTDAYRIFHGTNEGFAGLTVDRYGPQLLLQTFREGLSLAETETICRAVNDELGLACHAVYHDRCSQRYEGPADCGEGLCCRELGVRYAIRNYHRGRDPLLFLDLRAARRHLLQGCHGLSVLNVFAYTCGAGICAAVAGAVEVWNVDFAASSLDIGRINARMNGVEDRVRFVREDFFPAIRQLAGLPVKGRGAMKPYQRLERRGFDLVFLDPPRWAKSPFGTVDVLRDYPSLLKPAILAANPGGQVVCTNHLPAIALEVWLDIIIRCAAKAGRPAKVARIIPPEADFPSPDGRHPLKIAVLELG